MKQSKDYSKIKYLKFSAEDEYEGIRFQNIIIDLASDRIESGYLTLGEAGDPFKSTYNLNDNPENYTKFKELLNTNDNILHLFAKVVDSGEYYLLDEKFNELYKCIGYVPHLMDYYSVRPCYGDYIRLNIKENKILEIPEENKKRSKISYNYDEDWLPISQSFDSEDVPSRDYIEGWVDGFASFKIAAGDLIEEFVPKIVAEVISVLGNINNKTVN